MIARIFALLLIITLTSCASRDEDNPLIIPPNYDEVPSITQNNN